MELLPGWIPDWLVGVVIMLIPAIVVCALYRWFTDRLIRLADRYSPFAHRLLQRGRQPVGAIILIFVLGITLPAARFPDPWTRAIGQALLVALILALGWIATKALDVGAELYMRRFRIDTVDNFLARKHVTQVNILRRAIQTLLVVLTLSAALMTVDAVRQYGVSLFASAGAAGIVVGLAARPVISNLLAGIQIAVTQPIRVEDTVIIEGEWGWIETITSTYVVVRLWDLRRFIVPLTHFIEKPFQNWTYESRDLLGTVFLHTDYTAPIERMREKLREIAGDSDLWDGKVAVLQVTDASQNTLQLRALVSARNADDAWDLRCLVREKLVAFLRAEYPEALPRQRTEVAGPLSAEGRPDAMRAAAYAGASS